VFGHWLYLVTTGDFASQLVMLGKIAEIHGRQLLKPEVVFGDFFSQLVILGESAGTLGGIFLFLGETAGILGRHLVKPLAVSGDLELLLQHPEPSCPDLAVNKLPELVDWPQIRELHNVCWPPSPLFFCLTPAHCSQLYPPEPTLGWEDHHLMKGSQLTLRGESERSGGRGRGKVEGGQGRRAGEEEEVE